MKSIPKIIVWISLVFCAGLARAQDIFIASYNGDLETVKKMVDENPGLVNARNDSGRFPLEMAAQTGKIDYEPTVDPGPKPQSAYRCR